jgi:hypothetical protein
MKLTSLHAPAMFAVALGTALGLTGCETPATATTTTRVTRTEYRPVIPTTRRTIVVTKPLPPLRVETRRPVSPNPNYVWVRGHWDWQFRDWVWVSGQWMEVPFPGAVFVEGRYLADSGRYVWDRPHWERARVQGELPARSYPKRFKEG